MTVRHFCTYFDHNYLPRAIVMLESLYAHCSGAHVYVLCLSDECYNALAMLAFPFVSLIRLAELEAADQELAATRSSRSLVEYYFTITPCLPWYLLTRLQEIDALTYLDADMWFTTSPEPIFREAQDASVIITPHRFSANLAGWECHGMYNVSWLTFRKTEQGLACLAWYRESCLEWCYDRLENTRYADQKYLDSFPDKFLGVHVILHMGSGVAPWNIQDAIVEQNRQIVTVNGAPLIFYHAQGMKHIWGAFYASGFMEYGAVNDAAMKYIIKPYVKEYAKAVNVCTFLLADQTFSGIRTAKTSTGLSLGKGKSILKEFIKHSLVVQFA